MIIPVLLAGGVGSRLWPVSRELYPKQFLPLVDQQYSMLQQTYQRLEGLPALGAPIVICNENHRFLVAEQLRQLQQAATILLEPQGKNTAPAAAVAALQALKADKDALILVLPADHVISQPAAFLEALELGVPLAKDGKLVTFGIVPSAPETGYGYIQRGSALAQSGGFSIEQFVEKPNLDVAEKYVASGEYYWNSGMFLMSAQAYLDELKSHCPEMRSACEKALESATQDMDFFRLDAAAFAASPSDSIDYAVMEKTSRGAVLPLDCGWSDVGSWSTLWEVQDKDEQGNVVRGDVMLEDVKNSYVRSGSKLVSAVGLDNVVVVETKDAVLVADKSRVQDVKNIVKRLQAENREEATAHTKVYRPWGSYESLVIDSRFQVKRIIVDPGHKLSLQMHHHRAEHWVVVKGTARVTNDEREILLGEDQSTYIPLGHTHRLENPGVIPLELIEIQTGSYLGEDDIVRFEDKYGR